MRKIGDAKRILEAINKIIIIKKLILFKFWKWWPHKLANTPLSHRQNSLNENFSKVDFAETLQRGCLDRNNQTNLLIFRNSTYFRFYGLFPIQACIWNISWFGVKINRFSNLDKLPIYQNEALAPVVYKSGFRGHNTTSEPKMGVFGVI